MSKRKPILRERIVCHFDEYGILDLDQFSAEVGYSQSVVRSTLAKCLRTDPDLQTIRFLRKGSGQLHVKDQPGRKEPGLLLSYRHGIEKVLGFQPANPSSVEDRAQILLSLGLADPMSITGKVIEELKDGAWHVSTELAESCVGRTKLNIPVTFRKVKGKLRYVGLELEERDHQIRKKGKLPKAYRLSAFKLPEEITHEDLLCAELNKLSHERFVEFVSVAVSITKNRAAAEDIVQKALTRILEKIRNGDFKDLPVDKLKSYLFAAIRNRSINYYNRVLRRDRNNLQIEDAEIYLPLPQKPRPDKILEEKQGTKWVEALLAKLSAEHKEIIKLRVLAGLTIEEAADILGVEKGTVMSRKSRAMSRVREILAEQERIAAK